MSSPSVEPERIICGGSSCQVQYLSKIIAKRKASFKSLIADGTQFKDLKHCGVQNMLQKMIYFNTDHAVLID